MITDHYKCITLKAPTISFITPLHLPFYLSVSHLLTFIFTFFHCCFAGKVLHSHSYRYPEPFTNKSVVVLGARASGVDISIEIAQVKAQVCGLASFFTMSHTVLSATALSDCKLKGWSPENENLSLFTHPSCCSRAK